MKASSFSIFVIVTVSLTSGLASASISRSGFNPQWTKSRPSANESYLVGTSVKPERTLNDEVFDPAVSKAMRNEYETRVDADEARSHAGLTEYTEEKSKFEVMKDFARRAVDTMSAIRLKIEGDKLKDKFEHSDSFAREPVAAVVLAASLYTGRSMNFKVFDGTRVSSRVVLKDRTGSLSMPLASTGITSTLAYNAGEKFDAQFSRELTKNVSAVVGTNQKGSAQVVYSVSF